MTISLFKAHNISSEDQNLEKCNNAAFNIGSLNIWNGNVDAWVRHTCREDLEYFTKTILNHMLHVQQQNGFKLELKHVNQQTCSRD